MAASAGPWDLVGREARPLAEIDLDHVVATAHLQPEPLGEDRSGFLRALHRARIERFDLFPGETCGGTAAISARPLAESPTPGSRPLIRPNTFGSPWRSR
jgi:hypothetical protein